MDNRAGGKLPHIYDLPEPAWIWDVDRARISHANDAALAYWGEETLPDLLAREFDPSGVMAEAIAGEAQTAGDGLGAALLPLSAPGARGASAARCETAALALADGRQGIMVRVLGTNRPHDGDEEARLAAAALEAPVALLAADTSGRLLAENEAARALFGDGREPALAQRLGSSRHAGRLIEDCLAEGRAGQTRKVPTRFGPRLCRLTARRSKDPVTGRNQVLVQITDIEDERARLAEHDADHAALAQFLDVAADFYVELDIDLRVRRASPRFEEIFGMGQRKAEDTLWRDVMAQSEARSAPAIETAMEGRSGWRFGRLSVSRHGKICAFATHGQALRSDRGDFRGYRIVGIDLANADEDVATDGRPIQSARHQPPSDDFADVVDAIPTGVVIHRDFVPLYLNRAAREILAIDERTSPTPSVVPLLSLFSAHEQILRADVVELMDGALAYTVRELEMPCPGRDTPLTLEVRARQITWQGDPAIEYTIEDVSDARAVAGRGDETLSRSQAQTLRAIVDIMPEAVLLLRGNGTVAWANLAALRMLELPDHGPAPHDIADVLGPEDTSWALDYVAGLADGGLTHLFAEGREVTVVTASGISVPALMALEKVGDGAQVCAVLRDISEWRAEAPPAETEPAPVNPDRKTEFLAKVSHELRTPLTAMLGFAQVLARQEFGPIGNAKYVEYAGDILGSGEHLLSLINDLLDMSKVESGKLNLNFESVDVHDLAEGCVRLMSPIAGSRQVTLRHTVADTLPSLVADERSLRQILLNLISNALRFTEGGGEVIVSADLDDAGGLVLAVSDTGVGMNEAELAVALEPFEQVEKPVADGTPGTGLGLPLARALTEANRAQFTIESAPSRGTRVALAFPSTQVLAE